MKLKVPLEIDDTMVEALEVFVDTGGYATTGYLVDKLGVSRPTVTKRLDKLYTANCIEYVHEPTAFWRLKRDPREDNE